MSYREFRKGTIKRGDEAFLGMYWLVCSPCMFGKKVGDPGTVELYRRPLKTKESRKPIVNTGYTAALREKLKDLFFYKGNRQQDIDILVKRVQRLNAKHYT